MKKNKEQGVESDSSSLGEYTAEDDSDEERDRLGSMSDRLRGSKPTHSNGTGCPSPKKVAEPLPAARGSAPEKTRQSINRSSSENRMKFGGLANKGYMKRKTSHDSMNSLMQRAASRENMARDPSFRTVRSRDNLSASRSRDSLHGRKTSYNRMHRNASSENLMRRDPSASLLWAPATPNEASVAAAFASKVRRKVSSSIAAKARGRENNFDAGVLSDPDLVFHDELSVHNTAPLLPKPKGSKPVPRSNRFCIAASVLLFSSVALFLLLGFVSPGFFNCAPNAPAKTPFIPRPTKTHGSADVIIIGGGVAGLSATAQLLNNKKFADAKKITVLELGSESTTQSYDASDPYRPSLTQFDVPGEYSNIAWIQNEFRIQESRWTFLGKAFGGSGVINGALYQRANADELTQWPQHWQLNDIEQYYAQVEDIYQITTTPSRDGIKYLNQSSDLFEGALKASGFKEADMSRGVSDKAYSPLPVIAKGGLRQSAIDLLVQIPPEKPGKKQECGRKRSIIRRGKGSLFIQEDSFLGPMDTSAEIMLESGVKRLVMDPNGTAVGVVYEQFGEVREIKLRAGGAVIMAAGAVQTPRLLWQSSIGPSKWVKNMVAGGLADPDAPVLVNAQIGSKLTDHVLTCLVFNHSKMSAFRYNTREALATKAAYERFINNRTGAFAQYGPTSFAQFYTPYASALGSTSENSPNIEYFVDSHGRPKGGPWGDDLDGNTTFEVFALLLKPTSVGSYQVFWGGPDQDVKGCGAGLCRPGDVMFPTDAYLGTQNDIDVMIAGVTQIIQILNKTLGPDLKVLLPESTTPAGIRHHVITGDRPATARLVMNHFAGSAPLDDVDSPGAVDATTGIVHATTNVYIADASLFPKPISAHPFATSTAVAMKIADLAAKKVLQEV